MNNTRKRSVFGAKPCCFPTTRLTTTHTRAPKLNHGLADHTLHGFTGKTGFSIKRASSWGNVAQVSGLSKDTTATDVEVRSFSSASPELP